MALESWLIKVKTAISNKIDTVHKATSKTAKRSNVGVLAFEIAGLMSKLLQLWQSLSDKNIARLRHESISLIGVRKIVSHDDTFLLGLACAEMVESLRLVAKSICRLGKRCDDLGLQQFDRFFDEFAESGRDTHNWIMTWKEMESRAAKKMNRYVTATAALHKQIDELAETEHGLKKLLQCSSEQGHESPIKIKKIAELQQKLFWQKQEVKHLKESSLWSRSFDAVTSSLARSVFTVLSRIKLVFGVGHELPPAIASLHRSLSVSATVHPSENPTTCKFISGPLTTSKFQDHHRDHTINFLDSNKKLLKPPASTLGAAALALHYANLIIVIEKMIQSPQLVGVDARDDLYVMLPTSIRVSLRARLRGVRLSASDPALAGEWRDALWRILEWLAPLAHNMIKWQSERSFEQQNMVPRPTTILLLQTLFFANQEKTEAAITELLVGLNYIWRFEKEMNAKALFDCSNFKQGLSAEISPTSSA
ncbi:protein PSK SIMULATOR 1 [Magnolia sinica]|uniref:protein PSK SIMULATOR 1 n=1 Tax=Magnolia sinica TaxID=86752 RepID=UPI00265B3776|nr:protein PSK SIMULATOR 1 [Magnolia sinica]